MKITAFSAVNEPLITYCLLRFTAFVVGVDADGKVPFVVQIIQRTKQRKAKKLSIRADLYRVRIYQHLIDYRNLRVIDRCFFSHALISSYNLCRPICVLYIG